MTDQPVQAENRTDQDKAQRRMERKLQMAHDPDSIFIMPVGGRMGIGLVINITSLDRSLNTLKRQMVFRVKEEDGIRVFDGLQRIIEDLWDTVREHVPSLHSFRQEKWRELNDSKEKKLVLANRKASMAILPRDEKIAQIAAGVKVLDEKIFELQALSRFEELGRLVQKYRDMDAAVGDAVREIEKLTGMDGNGKK